MSRVGDAEDYPAAHSMDTMWFGVDADGKIGLFETYEGGAAPWMDEGRDVWIDSLLALLPKDRFGVPTAPFSGEAVLQAIAGDLDQAADQNAVWLARAGPQLDSTILVLRDQAALDALMETPNAVDADMRNDTAPIALFASRCAVDALRSLDREGGLLGVQKQQSIDVPGRGALEFYEAIPHFLGVYVFQPEHSQRAEPYEKVAAPERRALTIADLERDPRAFEYTVDLSECAIDDIAAIQPIVLTRCSAWSREYWDADGALRLLEDAPEDSVLAKDDPERRRRAFRPKDAPKPDYAEPDRSHAAAAPHALNAVDVAIVIVATAIITGLALLLR